MAEEHLWFMEENQVVVHWGLRIDQLDRIDPEVWQRLNRDPPEWHAEDRRFSDFIIAMIGWQMGLDSTDSF